MLTSILTQRGQATIPAAIRHKFNLQPGDKIGFEEAKGKIFIFKIESFDNEYHQALEQTLSEWSSTEDDEAFKNL